MDTKNSKANGLIKMYSVLKKITLKELEMFYMKTITGNLGLLKKTVTIQ